MSKILSFLSWNVENFHNQPDRVNRVVDTIAAKDPDVFGLYEVKGAEVFDAMMAKMPGYVFSITESPGVPEILVGVKSGLSAFVTQKDELQSKVPTLRPGALATIQIDQTNYMFLFLHLKSFTAPRDWGLRDDMFQHATNLKRKLDRLQPSGQKANFVMLGDINTMGVKAAYNDHSDMSAEEELAFVDNRMTASVNGMRRLAKTHDKTWWNGKDNQEPSSLDHVFGADHLTFKQYSNGAEVEVSGWVDQSSQAGKVDWVNQYSDHSILYGEIEST